MVDFDPILKDGSIPQGLWQTLVDTVVDGVIIIDSVGQIRRINHASAHLFGYGADEIIGRNVSMLMPDPYRSEHDAYLARHDEAGDRRVIGFGRSVVGQRKDGSTFPMYLSVGQGRLRGETLFIGIVQDLTARHEAEEAIRELQAELLHVARLSAMGQMTSGIAHELNQPLTAGTNYIRAAHRMLETNNDPATLRVRELLDKAANQTIRAGEIIRRLRSFVEKGESRRTRESINPVIEEAILLSFVGERDSGIALTRDFLPDLPDVLIDRIQIQQVIVNLVRNAIEALRGEGIRKIRVATWVWKNEGIGIEISDSGPGLPEEVLDRLFQPFVTTREEGMGIGLSICHSIIGAHHGEITVRKGSLGGASFHIMLPVNAQ